jgi:TolB-like protein
VQAFVRLYREARRRKVFRTAALYVVGAWALLQAAALSFPGFGIPEAAIRAAIWAAVLGFPVALVFGWLFEVGPGGIRRTPPVAAGEAAEPRPLARRDYLLLAAFACVALALLYQAVRGVRDTPVERATAEMAAASPSAERLANSIAVLPFANISSDPDNEYFCDGISEEILNALSGFRELNVIGRTSSFAFKESNVGIERIGAVLGVRHVLQGSVRKAGSQLRISAQLLDEGGRQIWTQSFDRQLANVFDIQSEIAAAVAATVAAHVTSRTASGYHPDLEAYDHYLAGREFLHARNTLRALERLQRAIDIDPDFAEAHAEWAIARLIGPPPEDAIRAAQNAIDRALALQPQLLRAQAARAFGLLQSRRDPAEGERILREVLAQEPNMSDALLWLANSLGEQGRMDEQLAVLHRAARIDPLHPSIGGNLARTLEGRGEVREAVRVLERQLDQPKPPLTSLYNLAELHHRLGQLVEFNAAAKTMALRGPIDDPWIDHYSLAQSYGVVGDWRTAEYWFDRQARDYPELEWRDFASTLVLGWQGRDTDALIAFRRALDAGGIGIENRPDYIRSLYGVLLARAGEHAAAIEVLEPLIPPDAQPGELQFFGPYDDGQHALAWAYLGSGRDAKAEALLSSLWKACQDWHAVAHAPSGEFHYCAETALLRDDRDQALALFERAVAAGWRDYYLREHDVYWASVANDPRYRALMAKVKANVDRQAAEIARIDASEDFVAKFDAAMVARKAAGT